MIDLEQKNPVTMPTTPLGPTTMTFAIRRIVLWSTIAAAVGVYAALLPSQRSAIPQAVDTPWIGLPGTGMDASNANLRMLLLNDTAPFQRDGPMANLSTECGLEQTGMPERYIAHVSKGAWGPFWTIQFDVDGAWLNVSIVDSSPSPPPPEPSRTETVDAEGYDVRPITRIRIKKYDAEPIRRIWSSYGLWHAEQKPLGCRDGMPVTLEACIDGHYAVRHRNCDADAYEPAWQLWVAVNRQLPAPMKVYRQPLEVSR